MPAHQAGRSGRSWSTNGPPGASRRRYSAWPQLKLIPNSGLPNGSRWGQLNATNAQANRPRPSAHAAAVPTTSAPAVRRRRLDQAAGRRPPGVNGGSGAGIHRAYRLGGSAHWLPAPRVRFRVLQGAADHAQLAKNVPTVGTRSGSDGPAADRGWRRAGWRTASTSDRRTQAGSGRRWNIAARRHRSGF